MSKKIMGEVVFSGNLDPDPDGCAAALREAGFEVVRMDERFKKLMDVPGDEFLEATKVGTNLNAIWDEITAIVERFNGDCQQCGEISDDHVPLEFLHEQTK
jgi:hypothetical protein